MSRVAGVVVVYFPPPSLARHILTYVEDVEKLYLFDNSPGESQEVVGEVCGHRKVTYLTRGMNVGIPAALNAAAQRALAEGCDFLLTMDQDSFCHRGMVPTLVAYAAGDPTIGIVSPFLVDRNAPANPPRQTVERVTMAVTSGSLVNLEAYEKIGGFLESLFIDGVDTEFCLRLQVHGFAVIRVNTALLSHAIGKLEEHDLFGMVVHATHHNPVRFFYQARNSVYLRKQYRHRFPEYFRIEKRYRWGRIVKMLLYESDRLKKTAMLIRGTIAGWRNDFSNFPAR